MSKLVYDGSTNTITMLDRDGNAVGSWSAHNRTTRASTLPFVPNGTYHLTDHVAPHRHTGNDRNGVPMDSANGEFGVHGIVRLNPFGNNHTGVGVHSGRANARDGHGNVGPMHVTEGCIRTTDEAMGVITTTMRSDPLETITVQHNSGR